MKYLEEILQEGSAWPGWEESQSWFSSRARLRRPRGTPTPLTVFTTTLQLFYETFMTAWGRP